MLDAERLSQTLTNRYGVHINGEACKDADGLRVDFRPADLPVTCGFSIGIIIGWRSVVVNFSPATYGRQVLAAMALSSQEKRRVFHTFLRAADKAGASVVFEINGQSLGTSETEAWPLDWKSCTFGFSKRPIAIDGAKPEELHEIALTWSSRMLGSVLALLPLEPIAESPYAEAEGDSYESTITRYERSVLNRQACIDFHGMLCKACGFDFGKCYGIVGHGYIEVHHVESIASLGKGTVLNPIEDLVPLCSNCHSMAHCRKPIPFTYLELKAMIESARLGI